jgi:hypothetical protein
MNSTPRSATDQLAAIERWSRLTAIAAIVIASAIALQTLITIAVGYDYIQVKRGIIDLQETFTKDLRSHPKP